MWRARDAISDNRYQVQSYLEHHWVIIKLVPCYSINSGEPAEGDDGAPNLALAINTILEAGSAAGDADSQTKRSAPVLDSPRVKRVASDDTAARSATAFPGEETERYAVSQLSGVY